MVPKRLERDFFLQPTLKVARQLLGKYLVRKIGNQIIEGKIIETEAYIGPHDKAAHAYQGKKTPRNQAEFLLGGHVYIYLVYGLHWQFNIVTGPEGSPECVLIRALDHPQATGPGKLCRFLQLDKTFYAHDLVTSQILWLEDRGENPRSSQIQATPRIGIDYAGPYWSQKKWRFVFTPKPSN